TRKYTRRTRASLWCPGDCRSMSEFRGINTSFASITRSLLTWSASNGILQVKRSMSCLTMTLPCPYTAEKRRLSWNVSATEQQASDLTGYCSESTDYQTDPSTCLVDGENHVLWLISK